MQQNSRKALYGGKKYYFTEEFYYEKKCKNLRKPYYNQKINGR